VIPNPAPSARGAEALKALLEQQTHDVRHVDVHGFRAWLERHLERWGRDPMFQLRCRVRDIRKADPRIASLEDEQRRVAAADAVSPAGARLQAVERALLDTGKAIAGLTDAMAGAPPERAALHRLKLDHFREQRDALSEEQRRLVAGSAERQHLLRVREQLEQLRGHSGLAEVEARLKELSRQRGRRSGKAGKGFEERALAATRAHLLPDLLGDYAGRGSDDEIVLLRGVGLGAARTEFDQVIVRQPPGEAAVEVLGVVEAKRNINDLAHGFRLRRQNLAWFTGSSGDYDPADFTTGSFRTGHFDRRAVHRQDGREFVFSRASFRRFRTAAGGVRLSRLCFVTRPGRLWGIAAAGLARIAHRVASDPGWDPGSDAYLRKLLHWSRSLTHATEAPDLLRGYSATPCRARRILLIHD
jgi:hypothetical protein